MTECLCVCVSVGGVVPGPVTGDLVVASFHAAGFCRRYRASYDVRFQHFLGSPCPGAGASLFCPAPRSKLQKRLASVQKKLWSTWKPTMTRYENWGAGAPRDTEALSRPFCRRLPPIRKTRSLVALSLTAWTTKKVEQLSTVPLIIVLLILLLHVPGQGQACPSNGMLSQHAHFKMLRAFSQLQALWIASF